MLTYIQCSNARMLTTCDIFRRKKKKKNQKAACIFALKPFSHLRVSSKQLHLLAACVQLILHLNFKAAKVRELESKGSRLARFAELIKCLRLGRAKYPRNQPQLVFIEILMTLYSICCLLQALRVKYGNSRLFFNHWCYLHTHN